MRRFWAPAPLPARGERLQLGAAESHHLLRVTGVAPGEEVEVFDGEGRAVRAALAGVEGGRAVLRVLGPGAARAGAPHWLVLGLARGPAMDAAVRMATELGAAGIVPVRARRSTARGDRGERWRRIARSAAAQCGRAGLPDVRPVAGDLDAAIRALPGELALRVCVPGAPPLAPAGEAVGVAVLVGPEGGWAPEEVEEALAAGARPAGLGPTVLRVETAVAAALARLA